MPGLARGTIRIELYDSGKATLIKAHDADLAQFALNCDGSRIASASEKGTLIRLWNCHTGEPLKVIDSLHTYPPVAYHSILSPL